MRFLTTLANYGIIAWGADYDNVFNELESLQEEISRFKKSYQK